MVFVQMIDKPPTTSWLSHSKIQGLSATGTASIGLASVPCGGGEVASHWTDLNPRGFCGVPLTQSRVAIAATPVFAPILFTPSSTRGAAWILGGPEFQIYYQLTVYILQSNYYVQYTVAETISGIGSRTAE